MSKIITILGPDRVGKSTLCRFLEKYIHSLGLRCEVIHFSGPKPWHVTPICQYIEIIEPLKNKTDFIICDRGGSEVCFYEQYRRNIHIPVRWALEFESYLHNNFNSKFTYLIKREWEWCKPHHIEEIKDLFPSCSDFWLKSQLNMRQSEHHQYYAYMEKYITYHSTLPIEILTTNELSSETLDVIINSPT